MSNLEEFKKIFDKEIKKLTKKIKELTDKYKKLDYDHFLLGSDIDALDKRLFQIENLNSLNNNINNRPNGNNIVNDNNIENDNNINNINNIVNDDIILNNINNNNEEGLLFRKQISGKNKIKRNNKMKEEIFVQRPNSKDKKIFQNYEAENNKKEKKKRRTLNKNTLKNNKNNLSDDSNGYNDNNIINLNDVGKKIILDDNDNNNIIDLNNINKGLEENKNLNNNSLIINNNNIENNFDIVSFGNNNLGNSNNLNNSMLTTTSGKFSEFSFNPQKIGNKFNNTNNNIQSKIVENTFVMNISNKNNLFQNEPYNNLINSKIEDKLNSEIVKDINEIKLILNCLPKYSKFSGLPEFQTLFQSSLKGDSAKTFHKFCDSEPNIILLIESKNGKRFGAYTKIGFSADGGKKYDDNVFLFSFDEKRIYKIRKKYKNICCDGNIGPCFGDEENKIFQINDNYLKEKSFFKKSYKFYYDMNLNKGEFNNEQEEFIVNKLEVIKILML